MRFDDCDVALTDAQVQSVEASLGLRFPPSLREYYVRWNGGSPDPYRYEDENLDTVVADCMPLVSRHRRGTSVESYRNLVLAKRLVPRHFFPFAVDGGGDYFFVDCSSADAAVYFYRGDSAHDALLPLQVGLPDFWRRLKPE
jgi:cell wall assembly regulator SMI1